MVYGNDVTRVQTVCSWFRKFRAGILNLEEVRNSTNIRPLSSDKFYINRSDVWLPHELTDSNKLQHIPLLVRNKLLSFNWDFLPHPSYPPDIAPSYYYLFHWKILYVVKILIQNIIYEIYKNVPWSIFCQQTWEILERRLIRGFLRDGER